ncbi:hypothetical protein GCM10018782_14570 [Streptomyces griseoaurantiacus]|nr:hypothetical protein GCM10018782_14570 [Streptomyces griseoaurantiacus]
MSRLHREHKRSRSAAGAVSTARTGATVTPIEVRVPVPAQREPERGPGGGATVGGMPVVAGTGESVQEAVLNHLHRLTLAAGHPVLATVRDERIGYVIPLRIHVDGSSTYAGQPQRFETAAPAPAHVPTPRPAAHVAPAPPAAAPEPPRDRATRALRAVEVGEAETGGTPVAPAPAPEEPTAGHTVATFMLRAVPEQQPLITTTPGLAQDLVAGPAAPTSGDTSGPRPPEPGTVQPPRGEFGPPPVLPDPAQAQAPAPAPAAPAQAPAAPAPAAPAPAPKASLPLPDPESDPEFSAPAWKPTAAPRTVPVEEVKEPPVREFDSVVDVVLAAEPDSMPGAPEGPFAVPMATIGEAVRQGRIDEAAALAEETVAEATGTLGAEHSEVLRLRELSAYIAYLAGDPLRSFHLSLDLARVHHRLRDARAAYGNVQSAAAAWRAVRDPLQGLHLGRDLLGTWTELAANEGPAAEDLEQLQSARNRMTRLADRARALDEER